VPLGGIRVAVGLPQRVRTRAARRRVDFRNRTGPARAAARRRRAGLGSGRVLLVRRDGARSGTGPGSKGRSGVRAPRRGGSWRALLRGARRRPPGSGVWASGWPGARVARCNAGKWVSKTEGPWQSWDVRAWHKAAQGVRRGVGGRVPGGHAAKGLATEGRVKEGAGARPCERFPYRCVRGKVRLPACTGINRTRGVGLTNWSGQKERAHGAGRASEASLWARRRRGRVWNV
jgi:hypothetical protein